jgi:hypothetical protein
VRLTWKHLAGPTLLVGLAIAAGGCPLRFEEDPQPNQAPNTFYERQPPDTSFVNEVTYAWLGTDLDSDVVAFQYQLVETDSLYYYSNGLQGSVIRSLIPRSESSEVMWTDRTTDDFQTFRDLEDGWYEFRTRSIDSRGAVDDTPATHRFFVFFDDIPPVAEIRDPCGRIGGARRYVFPITASDDSRRSTTPRSKLEYSVQLRSQSPTACPAHAGDPFTDWRFFPSDDVDDLILIGDSPPTLYQDLDTAPCTWTFTLRVRDPAGLITVTTCDIVRDG